jgi:hypothetical protein
MTINVAKPFVARITNKGLYYQSSTTCAWTETQNFDHKLRFHHTKGKWTWHSELKTATNVFLPLACCRKSSNLRFNIFSFPSILVHVLHLTWCAFLFKSTIDSIHGSFALHMSWNTLFCTYSFYFLVYSLREI